ncbi:hypothetical protein FH403_11805 [Salmonella enterica]|nr:hypothetical protein [Salmonella enterica]ECD9475722.1 hypothetical protein [Salmonella enterica subsp. houtenae]
MKRYFVATGEHISEYPEPISFSEGTHLHIHEKYEGDECWDNWYFCVIPGHPGGWVPEQLIEWAADRHHGISTDCYTARELNVKTDDILTGTKEMNGWVWCLRTSDQKSGWVPKSLLKAI